MAPTEGRTDPSSPSRDQHLTIAPGQKTETINPSVGRGLSQKSARSWVSIHFREPVSVSPLPISLMTEFQFKIWAAGREISSNPTKHLLAVIYM